MTKTFFKIYLACFVAAGVVIAFGNFLLMKQAARESEMAAIAAPEASSSATMKEYIVKKNIPILPVAGNPQRGKAKFEVEEDKLHIFIELANHPTAPYSASINKGSCADPKEVAFNLNMVDFGNSDTILDIPEYEMVQGMPLVITEYQRPTQVVACGIIQ